MKYEEKDYIDMKRIDSSDTKKRKRKETLIFSSVVVGVLLLFVGIGFGILNIMYNASCDDTYEQCDGLIAEILDNGDDDLAEIEDLYEPEVERTVSIESYTGKSFGDMIKSPFRWGLDGYEPEVEFKGDGIGIESDEDRQYFMEYRDNKRNQD